MNGLDIFSGIGGITYALQEYVQPIAYCEIEPFCQSVLLSRMQKGDLPKAPIWDDIKTLETFESGIRIPCQINDSGAYWTIEIIYGGFPCQDISVAGNAKGLAGERSGLFFEIMRLAEKIRPKFLFLENVPAITTRGGLRVVKEITEMGYDCRWCIISAASVGALHRRERWFLLANATGESSNRYSEREEKKISLSRYSCQDERLYEPFKSRKHWQEVVSGMGRVTYGVSHDVDRLKSLGNAVVPQQVRKAWEILFGLKDK